MFTLPWYQFITLQIFIAFILLHSIDPFYYSCASSVLLRFFSLSQWIQIYTYITKSSYTRMQPLRVMRNEQYFHISSRVLAIRQFYRFPSYRHINNLARASAISSPEFSTTRETKSFPLDCAHLFLPFLCFLSLFLLFTKKLGGTIKI